jgi:sec-independent protein translocase protein TatB
MGFSEMVFIFFVALIVFGPKRLPEIGRQIGKLMAEFKRHSNEFKSQLENEIRQMELQEAVKKMDAEMPKILPPQNTVPATVQHPIATTEQPPAPAPEQQSVITTDDLMRAASAHNTETRKSADSTALDQPAGPQTPVAVSAAPTVSEPPIKGPDA